MKREKNGTISTAGCREVEWVGGGGGCIIIKVFIRAQELFKGRGGRLGLPSLINLRFRWT